MKHFSKRKAFPIHKNNTNQLTKHKRRSIICMAQMFTYRSNNSKTIQLPLPQLFFVIFSITVVCIEIKFLLKILDVL